MTRFFNRLFLLLLILSVTLATCGCSDDDSNPVGAGINYKTELERKIPDPPGGFALAPIPVIDMHGPVPVQVENEVILALPKSPPVVLSDDDDPGTTLEASDGHIPSGDGLARVTFVVLDVRPLP